MAFAFATALLATLGGQAKADIYAYSEQTLSGFTFTGATIDLPNLTTTTNDGANQNVPPAGAAGDSNPTDSLQAFIGAPADNPGENSFTPHGVTATNYVRSDVLITPAFTVSTVAEGNLTGLGSSGGQSQWTISAPITVTSAGTVTLSFTFANLLTVISTGALGNETGSARYSFSFSIDTLTSPSVNLFQSAPIDVNAAVSRNNAGTSTQPGGGVVTITSTTLAAGTYQATITGSSGVLLTAAVPEPASCVMLGLGGLAVAGYARRRLRSAA